MQFMCMITLLLFIADNMCMKNYKFACEDGEKCIDMDNICPNPNQDVNDECSDGSHAHNCCE